MPEQSSVHGYGSWAKQRIDEMDATLASIEAKLGEVKADTKEKTNQVIADLKKRRDEFQAKIQGQAEVGQAAAQAHAAQLDSQWREFEAHVKTYFDTVGKQMEQQQATFQEVAAAQAKAWRDAAEALHNEATKIATARRADVDSAIKQMKEDAAEAEAKLQKLKQTGADSWATLSAALADSRKSFDRANQEAWEALKRAVSS
jgi:hypothetical protein